MKTKTLISCAVSLQLICVFVFTYAKSRFSHDAAHIVSASSNNYPDQFSGRGSNFGSGSRQRVDVSLYSIIDYHTDSSKHMSLVVRKPVFGVSDQVPHKPGCTATDG